MATAEKSCDCTQQTDLRDLKSTVTDVPRVLLFRDPAFKCTSIIQVYDPFAHRKVPHPTSVMGSIAHLIKSCLGTGILAMPSAFKNAGLVIGSLGVIITGCVITHTVHVLVRTAQEACVVAKKPSMSFADTCGAAFTYGPRKLQSWGPFIRHLVDLSMIMCYVSVLCVYVVFIAESLKEVIDDNIKSANLSIQMYCAALLLPLILICQIRSLKFLVPFSHMANIGILIVFIITLYYIFSDVSDIDKRKTVASINTWPLFFSIVVFAMEGIGVVLPIENEMAEPQKFLSCPGVLNISMAIIVILYGTIGFFGYVHFGDIVKGSVTLNLPPGDVIAQSTKLLMAFVIFLSFTIQFYVPMEAINRRFKKLEKYEHLKQISIRTAIVCFAVGVAALFPNLELVISFVGAIFFSTFGILFPAIVETLFRWDRDLGCRNWILWKNVVLGLVAILALVSGTYTSIVKVIMEFI